MTQSAIRSLDIARGLFVLTGAIAQIVFGALPFILDWENTVGSRSNEVQTLLTPASYAFSIWSLLFLGCLAYAVIHLFQLSNPLMRRTAWWAGLAFWFNTAWESWVPFFGIEGVSLGLITVCWLACVVFVLIESADSTVRLWDRLVRLPLYALGGWLNAAAFVNLLIVAELYNWPWLGEGTTEAAITVFVGALLAASFVIIRTGSVSYAAASAWGVAAIYVTNAEGGDRIVAYAAAIGVGLLVLALLTGWTNRIRLSRTRSFAD